MKPHEAGDSGNKLKQVSEKESRANMHLLIIMDMNWHIIDIQRTKRVTLDKS